MTVEQGSLEHCHVLVAGLDAFGVLAANTGWVNAGIGADTGAFAVASIRNWWEHYQDH